MGDQDHVTSRDDASASWSADRLDESRLRRGRVLGVETRYYDAGEGEVVVLLHGGQIGFVDSLDSWSRVLPRLQSRYRVLALDKLGQGHTDAPRESWQFTQTHTLAHAVAWLKGLGVSGVHLVGHSRGGLLAAQIALTNPDLVSSVVVVDSGTLAPEPADPRFSSAAFYERLQAYGHVDVWDSDRVVYELRANSYSESHISDAHIARRLAFAQSEPFQSGSRRMAEGLLEAHFTPDLERNRIEALKLLQESGLPVPVLQIWGADDPSASLTEVGVPLLRRLQTSAPSASMHVICKAGHYPFREHPQEFVNVLTCHIASLRTVNGAA